MRGGLLDNKKEYDGNTVIINHFVLNTMNQLKAGVFLNYVIIALNALVGLLYTPYMLRMMGQSEYGLYSLVTSVIAYLTIMDFGFGNAIIRYTAKFRAEGKVKEQSEMFGMFMVLYSVIGVLALLGGILLYLNVDNMFGSTMTDVELEKAKIMMLILAFNLAVTFPFSIYNSVITAYEDFVFQKSLNIIRIILNTAVMVCLLEIGYRAIAMVITQTVFNLLTLLLNAIYCKHKLKIKFLYGNFQWGFLKEVAIYSFWIFLNAIMDRIYWSTGQFVLGAVSGTTAISVFALAITLVGMYMQFSSAISGVFLPRVTAMVATHKPDIEISDLFIRTGRLQYIILAFILSGFIVFGKAFMNIWAGPGYDDTYIITLIFFVALLVPLIQNVGITVLQARNEMKFRSILYIIIAVLSLAFQVVLARKYDGIGCAIAISGALLLGQGVIMNIYYKVRQRIDIAQFWKEIFKMSIVPILMIVIGLYVVNLVDLSSIISFLIGIVIYSIVYIPLFWFFSMSKYERELLKEPLSKFIKRK